MRCFQVSVVVLAACVATACFRAFAGDAELKTGLVGHWPLAQDARDVSGHGFHAEGRGVVWDVIEKQSAARFNGRGAVLEVGSRPELKFGTGDFSVAAWVRSEAGGDDVPGDIVSLYEPTQRRGFHLALKTNTGVTFNQPNWRNLQFGVDANRISEWRDRGRPGTTSIVPFALAVHDGELYAGTCEPGVGGSGHVYRLTGDNEWLDCGAPDKSNSVTAMAVFGGKLYAGTGKYRLAGSALSESENATLGGRIFRYDGGTRWTDCGQLPNAEAVSGLVVFRGQLYAGSLYKPAGFFRYDGESKWVDVGTPDGKRVEALGIFNGHLYATSYDGGHVYRFDGQTWTDCGQLGEATENTQTYSFAVYEGRLYVGTWRSGRVYRFEDLNRWTDVGRLGEELEVMGMLTHNGRLIAGTLPLAEVYCFDRVNQWERLTQLDRTPDVKYRRAWTLAEFQGQLFCGTLPSGRVYSCEVGKSVAWDHELPASWQHVTAVKRGGELQLFVNGQLKAKSASFAAKDFDLSSDAPLRIGSGPNDFFHGHLRDVRLYRRALSAQEAAELAKP